jgi:predicted phage replisome organizer
VHFFSKEGDSLMGQQKQVKRYYWLKLKEEFFQDKEVKKLRKIAGGDTYTIIYLKLMLLSLKSDGRLYFDGIEETFYEELALEMDEDSENVRVTLMYLEKMGLVQLKSEDEIYLTQMESLIFSESESAERVRKHRAKMKQIEAGNETPQIGDNEANIPKESNKDTPEEESPSNDTGTEVKKEKEPKHKYGEYSHVRLTDTEYKRLCNDYGEIAVKNGIDNVDKYCQMNGKTYKDYNLVLRGWGIKSPKLEKTSFTALPHDDDEDTPSEEWTRQFEG